jgi:hypothetical protein
MPSRSRRAEAIAAYVSRKVKEGVGVEWAQPRVAQLATSMADNCRRLRSVVPVSGEICEQLVK